MLLSAVSVLVVAQSSWEIPEGLMNNPVLRAIVDAPWYVTNDMIHKDLGIPTVHDVIHHRKLESHSNPLLQLLPRDVI